MARLSRAFLRGLLSTVNVFPRLSPRLAALAAILLFSITAAIDPAMRLSPARYRNGCCASG